jgi:hypothetical protein
MSWSIIVQKLKSVVVCAAKHPPTIQVNVYGEVAGTGGKVQVSFSVEIQGSVRNSPMIPAHMFMEKRSRLCPGLIVCGLFSAQIQPAAGAASARRYLAPWRLQILEIHNAIPLEAAVIFHLESC